MVEITGKGVENEKKQSVSFFIDSTRFLRFFFSFLGFEKCRRVFFFVAPLQTDPQSAHSAIYRRGKDEKKKKLTGDPVLRKTLLLQLLLL